MSDEKRMPKVNKSLDYCILWVKTNDKKSLLEAILPRRGKRISIVDRESEEELASAKRRRERGFPAADPNYRYYGTISSLHYVKGVDVSEHVVWVFSNLKPNFNMGQWAAKGAEYGLSHGWWSGMGTDYGPIISAEVGGLLVKHNISLQISLYG